MPSSNPLAQWLAGLAGNIHHSDPAMVGIAVAALAGGCVFCSWRTWRNVSHIRLIEDTPTAKIRSAHQGYVELEGTGKLMDGPPIIAKLSGLPCVWFRYKIEQQIKTQHNGHTQTRWQVIEKGESTETFWLQDDTGRVVIDPEGRGHYIATQGQMALKFHAGRHDPPPSMSRAFSHRTPATALTA